MSCKSASVGQLVKFSKKRLQAASKRTDKSFEKKLKESLGLKQRANLTEPVFAVIETSPGFSGYGGVVIGIPAYNGGILRLHEDFFETVGKNP